MRSAISQLELLNSSDQLSGQAHFGCYILP